MGGKACYEIMPLNSIQRSNLEKAAQAAWESQQIAQFPGLLTLAQWALESAWGTSVPGNNPFGIKAYPHCYATQELPTREVENGRSVRKKQVFAVFPTLEDAFLKHAALLVTGDLYLPSFVQYFKGEIGLQELAYAIGKHYATDPAYGLKLVNIMSMPEVQAAWKAVAGEKAA